MVLVKRRAGARPIVSKTMILEVFRKTNNKMVAITMDKNKDKKVKWDNTRNKTSIIVESRDDSSLLLNKYESMNLEEEKR
jgi:2-C-methyl-D-erythritol 4-phosphate cytidylyltransferase